MKTFLIHLGITTSLGTGLSPALAQNAEPVLLDQIVITAGRTPLEAAKNGRATSVITREELEARNIVNVTDALRQLPGISISAGAGPTQLRMRGGEANHVLVLIDGIEASEAATGEFDFSGLQASDIERIEVLRGPQSAFWGSNALAGVINIITVGGERNASRWGWETMVGTRSTARGLLSWRGGAETIDGAVSTSLFRTDGHNMSREGDENDGSRSGTFSARFNADIAPNTTLDGTLRYARLLGETDAEDYATALPADSDDASRRISLLGSIGLTSKTPDDALTQRLRFSFGDTERRNYRDGTLLSGNKGRRVSGLYQLSYAFETPALADARHTLTAGYEWERESYNMLDAPGIAPDQLNERSRSLHGFVGEYRTELFDRIYLGTALRHDINDAFKNATTYSLSAAWQTFDGGPRLHASIGTGVTNPTFDEQFGYYPGVYLGNPNLKPEESRGWDVGIEQGFFHDRVIVDVTWFNMVLNDEIVYSPTFDSAMNLDGRSRRQGLEIAATAEILDGLTTRANYTYTDATDPDGVTEIRRPRHSASLNVTYTFFENRATVFGEMDYNGTTRDTYFGPPSYSTPVNLRARTLVNFGGSYQFSENLKGYLRIENLLDKEHEEVLGYRGSGRTALIGLKGSF
ncbi:TonB-dependent receptor plug domain-containing protein [Limoniibacter endophyticus]|nr:TonB-dependent receptor [Limoniibacter endophyticus]